MISIQVKEAIEKFKSVAAINAELRRTSPIKAHHRVWAQWGNVESREVYNYMLAYERVLKKAKEQLKQQEPTPNKQNTGVKTVVTQEAIDLRKEMKRHYACTCTNVTAQRYINQLEAGETPNVDGLFSFWFSHHGC